MAKTELDTCWLTANGIPAVRRHDLAVFETCPRDGKPGALRVVTADGRSPMTGRLQLHPISGEVTVHLDHARPGAPFEPGNEAVDWSVLARKKMGK